MRETLQPEVARTILEWKFSATAVTRMNRLAQRNRDGTITPVERDELEKFIRVGSLINLVQAKARLALRPE